MSTTAKSSTRVAFEQCDWCRTTGAENQRLRLELSRLQLLMLERPAPLALVPSAAPGKVIPIKKRTRRSKVDISDEACMARYAELREKSFPLRSLEDVLRDLCGWADLTRGKDPVSGVAIVPRCDWCMGVLAAPTYGAPQRCASCNDAIRTKSGAWRAVNDQTMTYTEAMAAHS